MDRADELSFVDLAVGAADLPAAEPDDGYVQIGLAESPVFHLPPLPRRRTRDPPSPYSCSPLPGSVRNLTRPMSASRPCVNRALPVNSRSGFTARDHRLRRRTLIAIAQNGRASAAQRPCSRHNRAILGSPHSAPGVGGTPSGPPRPDVNRTFLREVGAGIADGRIRHREDLVEGLPRLLSCLGVLWRSGSHTHTLIPEARNSLSVGSNPRGPTGILKNSRK